MRPTAPPTEVHGYTIDSFLGSGAFGEVWSGIDRKTGRKVAIKFYTRRSSIDLTLLAREVEKLAALAADRYVVQLLDVGWNAEPPYYVMDFIESGSLEDLLATQTKISIDKAVDIFKECAQGMAHLHGKGILHCDLKPGNVLLDQDHKPRLADFGQARLSHEQSPSLGTLFFMAPEQADTQAIPDARWDVYALGALLYRMLTGLPPYRDPARNRKTGDHRRNRRTAGGLQTATGFGARSRTRIVASPASTACSPKSSIAASPWHRTNDSPTSKTSCELFVSANKPKRTDR